MGGVGRHPDPTETIARTVLDLQHFGAHVREQHGGERAIQHMRQVEHAYASQRNRSPH
jgi:hypothetical protein